MFDEEVLDQVDETPVEQAEVQHEEVEQEVAPVKQKTEPAESFKIVRERALKAERERDEMARRLQEMQKPEEPEEDLEYNLGSDDLAEGKHLSKVDKKVGRVNKKLQDLEAQVQKYKQDAELAAIRAELHKKYSDFDDVVTDDNLAILMEAEPEDYETLDKSNANIYHKGVSAYKMIKRVVQKEEDHKPERELAIKNLGKPRPLISGASQKGNSPLSQANAFANGLTAELKAQLRAEMEEAIRRH